MGGVRTVHHVDAVDLAAHLLADAVEHPLRARTLDRDLDAREFGLERLGQRFGDREVHRRIVGDLALLPGGLDQRRRHRLRCGRGGEHACTEWAREGWPAGESDDA
jgi:hypothetical protein